MTIEQFLDGQCDWNRDLDSVPEERVYALIRDDPRRAWRLTAIERDRYKTLVDELGLRRPELRRVLRAAMLEASKRLAKEDQVQYPHARLLIEGILRPDQQHSLRFGWQDNQISEWARYVAGLGNGRVHRLAASDVLKLVLECPRNLAELGEDDQGNSELLGAVRQSVDYALRSLLGLRLVPSVVWAKLIVVRIVCSVDPEDGDHGLVKDMMKWGCLSGSAVDDLKEALRGGDDATADGLRALMASKPDFAELCKQERFREQCVTLGVKPDPSLMGLEYQGSDPWVLNVLREMRGVSPQFEAARREWLGLNEAERISRSKCLEILAMADVFKFDGIVRLVERELNEVEVLDVPNADRLRFARGLLARAIGVRLTVDDGAMNAAYMNIGGHPFMKWQEEAWERYRQSAKAALVPPLISKDVLRALRPDAMRNHRDFEPMAASLLSLMKTLQEEEERDRAVALGRGWLFDFVKHVACAGRPSDAIGVGVLEDADRQRIDDWARRFEGKREGWWEEAFERSGEELRFFECAIRLAERSNSTNHADRDGLRKVAEMHCGHMLHQMSVEDQARAMPSLNACVEAVVTGNAGVSPTLMTAFRRGDVRMFTRRLFGASVDLPAARLSTSRWDLRNVAWAIMVLVFSVPVLWEPVNSLWQSQPDESPDSQDDEFWTQPVTKCVPYYQLNKAELEQLVPDKGARELMVKSGDGPVIVRSQAAAKELLRRFKVWKWGKYPRDQRDPKLPSQDEAECLRTELRLIGNAAMESGSPKPDSFKPGVFIAIPDEN